MNYTLNQLQIFLKVAQTQSVTKAAEELYLTQPAVSIQLKNFQDQFDIPLTEVVGRKLYVTDFGKEIASAAEAILNEVNAINYKTQAYQGQISGRLKISVVSTGKYVMPYF
ncbi:MAG: LysR family transcriptional regulator, partial [Sediminibacterium sp.]